MLIEKVRKGGSVAFDEVSEIIRWISDEVGLRKIESEHGQSIAPRRRIDRCVRQDGGSTDRGHERFLAEYELPFEAKYFGYRFGSHSAT